MKIEQTHKYDADAQTLFAHLTDSDKLCNWWTSKAASDPRDGGNFRYDFVHTAEAIANGRANMVQEGAYKTCSLGTIAFPWATPAGGSLVTFAVTNGEIKLLHSGLPEVPEMVEMLSFGWNFFMKNLATVLGGGADARSELGLIPA